MWKDAGGDASLISETWRASDASIWETQQGPIFMGSEKFENKHGVRVLVNEKWRKHQLDSLHQRMRHIDVDHCKQTTSCSVQECLFHPLGICGPPRCTDQQRTSRIPKKKNLQFVGGDFNAEMGSGYGVERVSVGPHTLKEVNKRRDWMKQWLMIQIFTAFYTTYRKTPEKQGTYRTPKKVQKNSWTTCWWTRNTYCSRDAEAHDMIHTGSDHRSVVAQFVVTTPKK